MIRAVLRSTAFAVLAAVSFAAWPGPARAADQGVLLRDKDRIAGTIETGDEDAFDLDLAAGARLRLALVSSKGSELLPSARLFQPDGAEFDLAALTRKAGTRKPEFKSIAIPAGQTGRWQLRVAGADGTTGAYQVSARIAQPTLVRTRQLALAPGQPAEVAFAATSDATLRCSIHAREGGLPAGVALLAPDGSAVPGTDGIFRVRRRDLLARDVTLQQGFGDYRLVLTPSPDGDAEVSVTLEVKFPKTDARRETLADEPALASLSPAQVKQEDDSVALELSATGVLPGTGAAFDGEGLTVKRVDVHDDGTATIVVDADAAAPYGARRLVLLPPELLGESQALADALTVRAPDPVLLGVSLATGEQGQSGVLLEVDGTGFRTGGTLTVSGTGVSIGATEIVSATLARAAITIAPNAPVGPRSVTYTQPDAGGAAAATFDDAFDVTLMGPTFTSITPNVVMLGAAHVNLRIVGTGFNAGTAVTFTGTGITVHSTTFRDAQTLDVDASVASDAAMGARSVTITPAAGGGPSRRFTDRLTVAGPDPVVTGVSHLTLAQGASGVPVIVTGRNFRPGDTLAASGSGVTFSGAAVSGTTVLTATADVAGGAATGLRNLTVTHAASEGGRSGSLANAFRVVAGSPTVASVSPGVVGVAGSGGPTLEAPLVVTGTNFGTGATVSFSRSGASGVSAVPGSAVVVSDTRLEVVASLAGNAGTGLWNVLVTNPGGGTSGTSGNGKLDVKASSVLAVNRVMPSSGSAFGGERVTIQGSGFLDGCVVDFGTVRAAGTQVLNANTIVTLVPRPAALSATAPTSVAVKVTPPAGSAVSLAEGYAYAAEGSRFVTVRTIPAQGATGVPTNLVAAVVELSAPLDPSSRTYGTTTGVDTFWFESGGTFVASGLSGIGPTGRHLVFSRSSGGSLSTSNGGVHVLDIPTSLRSISGRAFVPTRLAPTLNHDQQSFTLSSSTTDTAAPALSSVSPSNGSAGQDTMARVVLVFSEELNPLTVSLANITFRQGANTVPAVIDLSSDLKTVTITPERELATNTTYTTNVTANVQDLCGNAITAVTRTFTTGNGADATAPSVDAVVLEGLPAALDGSGAYTNSSGVSGRPFDLYLPRDGWRIDVSFSDTGGSGIDATTFSAKCSVAVGSNAANAELASSFTVTSTGATWRVPSSARVASGEDVVFTFTVKDLAGNTSSAKTVTIDVVDRDSTATPGGDHDPFDARRTWVLRADLDAFTASFTQRTSPANERGATTTAAPNNLADLDEALRLIGLNTGSMSTASAATVNGAETGTNAIVRRMFLERLRELLNERFAVDEDGAHGPDAVDIEFLLPGEQGSLATQPVYSTANSSNSQKAFSEMSFGGTAGAEANAYTASANLGEGWYDARNLREEANLNTGAAGDTGVFLLGAFKRQVNSNQLFLAKVSSRLVAVHGGTPVGEDANDDDVLAGTFNRAASGNATRNARYDAILDAVEHAALYASAIAAHEIGHSLGLVPDGAPKTGLFGAAHYGNAFTEATSASPNSSHHLDYLGNDLMGASLSFDRTVLTGDEFMRFSPLDLAFLRNRVLHDEGK